MSQYDALTKYIPLFEQDKLGEWVGDSINNKGKIQMPYVQHSMTVILFIDDVYQFIGEHEALHLIQYREILEKNNITYNRQSMIDADISVLDGQVIIALILGIIRADRFTEGLLLYFLREGYITKWLKRLKELDTQNGEINPLN